MIRLTDATADLLRVTPSGADAVKAVVSYSDKTATAYTGGTQVTAIAAASITTICGTPGASTIRDIDHVTLYCAIANTLSVGVTVSATEYMLIVAALSAGDTLEYTHAGGWRVTDSSGSIKYNLPGFVAASGKTLTVSNSLTLAGTDGTTMTFPGTSDTVVTLTATQELDNKTLDSSVGKGTWTASGTWTLPAVTLGGAVTVPTGVTVTGAGTAAITGFKSGSFGTAGNSGTLALLGTTSGTATFSVDATSTTVTLDKNFSAAIGVFSGTATTALVRASATGGGDVIALTPLAAGSGGVLAATNSTLASFAPIAIKGSTVALNIGATPKLSIDASGNITYAGTTQSMTTSGTTLTVGVGADNGTVSAGVFTDRTKAFEGDAVGTLNLVKAKNGHIDHTTLPAFARENVRKQTTDADGKVTETVEVERNIGAMVSILTVAAQELDARVRALEAK